MMFINQIIQNIYNNHSQHFVLFQLYLNSMAAI